MSKATVIVEGYVASDPELRQTNGGKSVASVDVAHTPRRKNAQTGEWEDAGPTEWFQAAFWEDMAGHVAQTIRKGMLVRVEGAPAVNVYTTKDGQARANIQIKGATLAVVSRPERTATPQRQEQAWAAQAPADEPWATGGADDADTPF